MIEVIKSIIIIAIAAVKRTENSNIFVGKTRQEDFDFSPQAAVPKLRGPGCNSSVPCSLHPGGRTSQHSPTYGPWAVGWHTWGQDCDYQH